MRPPPPTYSDASAVGGEGGGDGGGGNFAIEWRDAHALPRRHDRARCRREGSGAEERWGVGYRRG